MTVGDLPAIGLIDFVITSLDLASWSPNSVHVYRMLYCHSKFSLSINYLNGASDGLLSWTDTDPGGFAYYS